MVRIGGDLGVGGSAAWKVILCIADVGSTTALSGGP